MPAPTYTDADLLFALQSLLPSGPVWPRDPDAVQTQTLAPLVAGPRRLTDRAANLLGDAFPVAPLELLPEWEATLGLPDPCAGTSPTVQLRQQQVAARFVAGGGQTPLYFINVASALGYTITITQFAPFRAGQNAVGQPLCGDAWAHAWQVNAPATTVESFRVGRDAVGEPLATWGNAVLECEIKRLAPAHTTVGFAYS